MQLLYLSIIPLCNPTLEGVDIKQSASYLIHQFIYIMGLQKILYGVLQFFFVFDQKERQRNKKRLKLHKTVASIKEKISLSFFNFVAALDKERFTCTTTTTTTTNHSLTHPPINSLYSGLKRIYRNFWGTIFDFISFLTINYYFISLSLAFIVSNYI